MNIDVYIHCALKIILKQVILLMILFIAIERYLFQTINFLWKTED